MDGELSACRRTLLHIRESNQSLPSFYMYSSSLVYIQMPHGLTHTALITANCRVLTAELWHFTQPQLRLSHILFKLMVHGECDILKSYAARNWYLSTFKYLILLRSRELMHEYTGTALLCGFTEVWTAFIIPNIKQTASLSEVCLYVWSSLFRTSGMSVVSLVCLASILTYLPTHLKLHIHDRHNFMAGNRWQRKGNVCHAR